jgi:hypothetical protein
MNRPDWLKNHWVALTLFGIVLASTGLATVWVFLVPIFQGPDEPFHLDYALCLNEHKGLFRAKGMPPTFPLYLVHPYAPYLWFRTKSHQIAQHPEVKVPPGYGTADYLQDLNRNAPPRNLIRIEHPPSYLAFNSFGYYGLLALWIGLLRLLHDQVVFIFYGARLFSVVLLAPSLVLTYASARELRLRPWLALVITACIGLFPMTSFVASYVQPDNLTFTLVSWSSYWALVARRSNARPSAVALLGLGLGALLVTKQHFYLAVTAAVVAMIVAEGMYRSWNSRRWLGVGLLLIAPSAATGSVYLWTIWGTKPYYSTMPEHSSTILFVIDGLQKAFVDFYSGTTHYSFWGIFGCMDTPLVIRGMRTNLTLHFGLQILTWILLALTLLRLEQVCSRLIQLWHRGKKKLACRLAFSNPLINAYFLFTGLMFLIYVRTGNRIGAQGRNWFPFLLPIFLTGLIYAPKALRLRPSRVVFAKLLTAALVFYVTVGSFYSVKVVSRRYYGPNHWAVSPSPSLDAFGLVSHIIARP